jgi:hypothetical protein
MAQMTQMQKANPENLCHLWIKLNDLSSDYAAEEER